MFAPADVARLLLLFIPLTFRISAASEKVCINKDLTPFSVRSAVPCHRNDHTCWSMRATAYTNAVRARHGLLKSLSDGTVSQLHNARRFAHRLSTLGALEHQVLSAATREVGCGRFVGGENVAYNYERDADVAAVCVRQWEQSPGHLKNILRDWFEEVVVGFYYSSDGRVYCVQTFTQRSSASGEAVGASCDAVKAVHVVGASGPTKTATPDKRHITASAEENGRSESVAHHENGSENETEKSREQHVYEARNACYCLGMNERCPSSMRRKSAYRCLPHTNGFRQAEPCRALCCHYCSGENFEDVYCAMSTVLLTCGMAVHYP